MLAETSAANKELSAANARTPKLAKQYERRVKQMNAPLHDLGEGVTILDGEGNILFRNQAIRDMTGLPDEQAKNIQGYPLRVLRTDGTPIPFEEWPCTRLIRTGEPSIAQEFLLEDQAGNWRHATYSGSAVLDEQGRVALAVVVTSDVTELRDLEKSP